MMTEMKMLRPRCFPSTSLRVNSGGRLLEADEFNHLLSITNPAPQIATRRSAARNDINVGG